MTKIVKASNTKSPKTPRELSSGGEIAESKNQIAQRGKRRTTSDAKVRRVMARDPQDPLSRGAPAKDVTEQIRGYSNPNVDFDPSQAPGAVSVKKAPLPKPGNTNAGHQKVIKYNNQQRTGGKTLKRH
jgi:hypothetical protein